MGTFGIGPPSLPSAKWPDKSELRRLTAALLRDSLLLVGRGWPTSLNDKGSEPFECELHEQQERRVSRKKSWSGATQSLYRRCMDRPASLATIDDLTAPELLALYDRFEVTASMVEWQSTKCESGSGFAASRAVMIASELARSERRLRSALLAPADFARIFARHAFRSRTVSWQCGISAEDAMVVAIDSLAGPEQILADLQAWDVFRRGISEDGQTISQERFKAGLHAMVASRATERAYEIRQAFSRLRCVHDTERELLRSAGIDDFCATFTIDSDHEFRLAHRGKIVLAPVFGTSNELRITPREWEECTSLLKGVDFGLEEDSESVKSAKPAEVTAEPRPPEPAPVASLTQRKPGIPVPGVRALVIWRGGAESARQAADASCAILASSLRTAWLAMFGNEPALEYLADSGYRETYCGQRTPRVEILGLQEKRHDVRLFPEDFSTHDWLQSSLEAAAASPDGKTAQPGPPPGALHLLVEADSMLRDRPRQSFVSSMAAIEACLGGKGASLSHLVSASLATLLIPQASRRGSAVDRFKQLYDARSRLVHGDPFPLEIRHSVFMRYVAACAIFAYAGLSRALARSADGIAGRDVRTCIEANKYCDGPLPGVHLSPFLVSLCCDGSEEEVERWMPEQP